jgi:hypothetical protein
VIIESSDLVKQPDTQAVVMTVLSFIVGLIFGKKKKKK